MKRILSMIFLLALSSAAHAQSLTHIVDHFNDGAGNPRHGTVTFILAKVSTSPAGLMPTRASVSAALDANGYFSVYLYPSASLSPAQKYSVWFHDAATNGQELIGIFDIPASSSIITLAPYRVVDTALAAQYTFADAATVAYLSQNLSSAIYASLTSAQVTNALGYVPVNPTALGSLATQNSSSVAITGGTITGSTTLNGITCTGCTNIGTGSSGGVANTGNTVIAAGTGGSGGRVSIQTHGGLERLGIEDDGTLSAPVFLGRTTTQTIQLNQHTVKLSPNWKIVDNRYIETNNAGAYLNVFFTGSYLSIDYDPSVLIANSVAALDYPTLKWRIDGGSWTSLQLTSGTTNIVLANNVAGLQTHSVELYLMGTSLYLDRWVKPVAAVRFTDLQVKGEIIPPPRYRQTWYFFSDSIGEGLNVLGAHTPAVVADFDSTRSWVYLLANKFNVDYANISFGGLGYDIASVSNLPSFPSTWSRQDAQHSRLGRDGLFLVQPDVIVIALGENLKDPTTTATNATRELKRIRAAAPAAKIIVLTPFSGRNKTFVTNGYNQYQTDSPDSNAVLFDATVTITTTDGLHPDVAGDITIANFLYPLIAPVVRAESLNLASQAMGGVASASSEYNSGGIFLPASAVNNGDRSGMLGNAASYWSSSSGLLDGEWVQVLFPQTTTINRITLVQLQDTVATSPIEPDETMTFASFGLTDFEVQYWNGTTWADVTGGNVTGNAKVVRNFDFAPVSTTKIRVLVHNAAYPIAHLVELEAYNLQPTPHAFQERLLATVPVVDMNSASAQNLFPCPVDKHCAVTRVVVGNASTSLTTVSFSVGWGNPAYNDVIANATHTELTSDAVYSVLSAKAGALVGTGGQVLKVLMNTLQGAAATATFDVYVVVY